jgi:hypothetical protein
MSASDLFFTTKPAFPWSLDAIGWPLFTVAAVLLVLFTLWTYRGHPGANRRRLLLVLTLRLLALLVALLTAVRPTAGVQEKPKIPSRLLIGIDLSESMTIRDEFGGQPRIDAVRKILARCQPILDELRDEQNCEVILYQFGLAEFSEATGQYDPKAPADAKKSDYGAYLEQTFQRWQGERFIRGHLIIGDGADNGATISAIDQAAKWRSTTPIQTFAVGSEETPSDRKDVGFAQVALDPDPVAVKNKVTLRARVNAFGLAGIKVPVKVQFDTGDGKGYTDVITTDAKLPKDNDNAVEIPDIPAPNDLPVDATKQPRRQIKVRVEIPVKDCPGDTNATNNVVETYLNLNKEGLRVLVVDRFRYEYAFLLDALTADKRIDVRKVDLQTDLGGEGLRDAFDFDKQIYDVLILGNVTPKQLTAIDPQLPQKIAQRVKESGMGFMMIGGHATLAGTPDLTPDAKDGWRGVKPIEELLPIYLTPAQTGREGARYQVVPDPRQQDSYLTKIGNTKDESLQLWDRLNTPFTRGGQTTSARFTALNRFRPEDVKLPLGTVYLWARDADVVVDLAKPPAAALQYPLLIGTQFDTGAKSRVLVFAAQNTELWRGLGQPKSSDGLQLHSRFWRQLVLWLAKQDEEDAAVWVRPEFPRLAVGAKQKLRFGMKGPNGAVVADSKFEVRVIPPGGTADSVILLPQTVGTSGEPLAEYTPRAAGEYTVQLTASGTVDKKEIMGEATARFIAYPEVSDELQRAAADYDFLRKLAITGGGKFHRLEDLAGFLTELKNTPIDTIKPRPKYIPDWRRNYSKGFLPVWLIVFATLLLAEWGLRRWWGMV